MSNIPSNSDDSKELREFADNTLPDNGILTLFTLPDRKHHRCSTTGELCEKTRELNDDPKVEAIYHACASFALPEVIIGSKKQFRVQSNVAAVKAAWADIDCGKEKAAERKGYPTKKAASVEFKCFLRENDIPLPTYIIDSGHGLHVYWAFVDSVTPEFWKKHIALPLDRLFKASALLVDPSRTTDESSVLRPPGTMNRKNKDDPKPVRIVLKGGLVNADDFAVVIAKALEKYGVQSDSTSGSVPAFMKGSTSNIETATYPSSHVDRVADNCAQIAHFRITGCDDSEPCWRAAIGIVKHCTDGEERVHEYSKKSPRYDQRETQDKLDNWTTGPTTCAKFRELNPEGCAGCQHTCTSPIQLGVVAPQHATWLLEMNAKYAWIEQENGVYRLQYRDFTQMERFHAAHANQTIEIATANGKKPMSVSRLWLTDKNRRQHKALVTRPSETLITGDNCLNDWAGFSCDPVPGDVSPFLTLYAHLFDGERYPLLWLAHLIQHPGIKMFVGLVVWSLVQGVGKNLLFETVGALFSTRHFALIGQSEVEDDFCGWIPGAVFVVADEVRASKNEKSRDRLKLWQTATVLRTHDKGQPKRVVDNLMNLVFLSNHPDGMFLDDYDRRYFVWEVINGALPESLKLEFLRWRDNGGLRHLLHYLLNFDVSGFDPKGRATITASKRDMIDAGRSDLDRWVKDVVTGAIPLGRETATAEELVGRFMLEFPHAKTPPQVATVGKVLTKMGAYRRDNQVRLTNGRKVRAFALQRVEHWKGQPEVAWRTEMEKRL